MKFIILCQARTGSSLLSELLNSHSAIHCDGEIFNPKSLQKQWGQLGLFVAKKFPRLFVWYNYRKRKKEHYGFKLILGQVQDVESFVQSLYKQGYILINLQRHDIIQTAFSACIAKQSGQWYINQEQKRVNEKIVIDKNELFLRITHTIQQNELQNKLITHKKYIDVVYESDLLDTHKQAGFIPRICEQLAIPIESLNAISIKTHERPLSERVSNYNELIAELKDSEYAQYVDASQMR